MNTMTLTVALPNEVDPADAEKWSKAWLDRAPYASDGQGHRTHLRVITV